MEAQMGRILKRTTVEVFEEPDVETEPEETGEDTVFLAVEADEDVAEPAPRKALAGKKAGPARR